MYHVTYIQFECVIDNEYCIIVNIEWGGYMLNSYFITKMNKGMCGLINFYLVPFKSFKYECFFIFLHHWKCSFLSVICLILIRSITSLCNGSFNTTCVCLFVRLCIFTHHSLNAWGARQKKTMTIKFPHTANRQPRDTVHFKCLLSPFRLETLNRYMQYIIRSMPKMRCCCGK